MCYHTTKCKTSSLVRKNQKINTFSRFHEKKWCFRYEQTLREIAIRSVPVRKTYSVQLYKLLYHSQWGLTETVVRWTQVDIYLSDLHALNLNQSALGSGLKPNCLLSFCLSIVCLLFLSLSLNFEICVSIEHRIFLRRRKRETSTYTSTYKIQ